MNFTIFGTQHNIPKLWELFTTETKEIRRNLWFIHYLKRTELNLPSNHFRENQYFRDLVLMKTIFVLNFLN